MPVSGNSDVVFREEKKLLQLLKYVDLVLEVLDARLPLTSRNLRLRKMVDAKSIIIMNKADLAEKNITGRWLDFFYGEGETAFPFSTKNPAALKELEKKLLQHRPSNLKFKRPLRLLVAGIPNVGKSSIINRLAGKFALKTGARPGITRGPQWLRMRAGWEMLDTPGILSPYLRSEHNRLALTVIGALETGEIGVEDSTRWLLSRIMERDELLRRFCRFYLKEGTVAGDDVETLIRQAGEARRCLGPGGGVDLHKITALILNDFRRGALGRISLEEPSLNHC